MLNGSKVSSRRNRLLSILVMLASALVQLATLAVLATASEAFALLPGEAGSYTEEIAGGRPVISDGTLNEARQGSTLLRVWRGVDNQVTMSFGALAPFVLGDTQTYQAPAVVPYSNDQFMIVHTGTDNRIWYTFLYVNGTWPDTSWQSVPFQSTANQVSLAQRGQGSRQVMMVYQGNPDQDVWATLYNDTWGIADRVGGGRSPSAPSITYNPMSPREFWVTVRGEDNGVYLINGSPYNWGTWLSQGVSPTYLSPTIAAGSNGDMVLSFINGNDSRPTYGIYDDFGRPISAQFAGDSTRWQTYTSVDLQVVRNAIFVILTGLNHIAYYKQVYKP
jgi:hypothetical protein